MWFTPQLHKNRHLDKWDEAGVLHGVDEWVSWEGMGVGSSSLTWPHLHSWMYPKLQLSPNCWVWCVQNVQNCIPCWGSAFKMDTAQSCGYTSPSHIFDNHCYKMLLVHCCSSENSCAKRPVLALSWQLQPCYSWAGSEGLGNGRARKMGRFCLASHQSAEEFIFIVFYIVHIKEITANLQLLANSYEFCRDFVLPVLGQAADDKWLLHPGETQTWLPKGREMPQRPAVQGCLH